MTLSPRPTPDRVWQRFVAIGDSFTEGMSDPSPSDPDSYVGWADRLAFRLAARNSLEDKPFGYANLAIRGRLLADVVGPQVETALALSPDLVSIVGGANDCLRPSVDLDSVADRLEDAVAQVRATGADVILATTADPVDAPVLKRVRGRLAVHAANLWGIGQRQGCYVLDLWTMRPLRDPRMWAPDRIHLTTGGHQRVAAQAAWLLGLPDDGFDWRAPLPPMAAPTKIEAAQANAAWTRTQLTPWVQRRVQGRSSGDGRQPKRPDVAPIPPVSQSPRT
ncbi:SGNH/GDSL hydrolase family protein [Luteipulveratus mongoliensis]|uniref:G-D-S-L family lipolytic protein n=1 Tax=Luteipulveratus mongoliensis TaxID=571913 RepID=A0A0K1JGU3_9MICO|nr:SGNH/GDSL hydrolase family protein [Luteipulveratus mongoliensis]AKU15805.1 G-D-S-L family lipolytic protein [Luteipulveratus mongoliensis]